jgi:hypothetical protein
LAAAAAASASAAAAAAALCFANKCLLSNSTELKDTYCFHCILLPLLMFCYVLLWLLPFVHMCYIVHMTAGEASAMEASQELEGLLASSSSSSTGANYMLIIAEDQQQQQQEFATAGQTNSAAAAAAGSGLLGVVAVDVGSGDIAYGVCSSMLGSSSSSSNSSSSSSSVVPLEAVLLSLSPAELVVCEPVSAATNRQLAAYMAGVAGRRCRLERLQQQQQQDGAGSSSSSSYLTAATLQKISEFYGGSSSSAAGYAARQTGQTAAGQTGQTTAAAAGQSTDAGSDAAAAAASSDQHSSSDNDLQFVLSLPPLVLVALAGAIIHLSSYGLTGVLRCTSGFRSLGALGSNMLLDGNALRQLEVLAAGVPVTKGHV